MRVYQLHIAPSESDGEGEDRDEWYATLAEAVERRGELIRENPSMEDHRYGRDYAIDCHEVSLKGKRSELVIACLRRHQFAETTTRVVEDYDPRVRR